MDFKKILKNIFLALFLILIGIFGTLFYQRLTGPKQTVTISGNGEIDAQVDQATIFSRVKNTSTTYALALDANKKDVATLKKNLLDFKIPESRITLSDIQPIYKNIQENIDNSEISMFRTGPQNPPDDNTVYTDITLVLDSLKNIEKVYQIINNNPNTKILNTNYSLKNQKQWEKKAKEEALKDARSQVESIAKINKLKVGKLVSITDNSAPLPMMEKNMIYNEADQSSSSKIIPKTEQANYTEQTVKIYASYTATYELY